MTTETTVAAQDDGQLLSAEEVRARNEKRVDIGGGKYVICQVFDMPTMVLEGLVPMPLLEAVQKMLNTPGTPEDQVMSLPDEHKSTFLNTLRKHACAACLKPIVTEVDTRQPGSIPVTMLTLEQLMAIYIATSIEPMVGAAQAGGFYPGRGADDVHAVSDGEGVSAAPEPVGGGVEQRSA